LKAGKIIIPAKRSATRNSGFLSILDSDFRWNDQIRAFAGAAIARFRKQEAGNSQSWWRIIGAEPSMKLASPMEMIRRFYPGVLFPAFFL